MPSVSIIIVGTNEKEYVRNCLDSILNFKTTYSYETILIDNASTDGTAEMVRETYPWVDLIVNEKKLGYIINNNIAMRMAKGDYLLLINSDIQFKENTLQYMLDFMEENKNISVSTCKLVFPEGDLQYTCRRFPTPYTYFCRIPHFFRWLKLGKRFAATKEVKRYLMMDYDHQEIKDVDWFLSAFFLLRREATDELGLLDEKLFQPFYLEDMDFCFRSHLKGWRVVYVPHVEAVHDYRRDSVKKFGKLSIVHFLNICVFFKKHLISMWLKKHKVEKRPS